MSPEAFIAMARMEGFADPVEVCREPEGFLNLHEHPFEAKALILDGEIEIGDAHECQHYRAGDMFHLQKNQPHWERYGPSGVRYLSARKD
ncbi:MAG: cupin [Betaproteobacteria bacterium]|nr:cupin [Betaproteobacteria bacterium]